MLKSTVPTPATVFGAAWSAGGLALASIRKTSESGRLNGTEADQLRPSSSTHWLRLNFTMRPTAGAPEVAPAGGGGTPAPAFTTCTFSAVVRLPDLNAAA